MMASIAAIAWLLLAQDASTPELAPLAQTPVENTRSVLRFTIGDAPAAGLAVQARYRENAHDSLTSTQEIGITDAGGRLDWTPEQAGVVVLTWEGGTHNQQVKYASIPVGAVIVAILAGIILLGGSVLFIVHMYRDTDSGIDDDQVPST